MMEYLPYLTTIIIAIGGSFVTVKVTMAEMRRDITHLKEKILEDKEGSKDLQRKYEEEKAELRADVKSIFRTLTKIQVDIAKQKP